MKMIQNIKHVTVPVLFLCLFSVWILCSCQKTPEEVMVTPREQKGNSYEEEEKTGEKLEKRLEIADSYSVSLQTPDGKTEVNAEQIKVEYPDVSEIPVYEVEIDKLNDMFCEQIAEALFGDSPLYHRKDYDAGQRNRAEVLKELEWMKECRAKGNPDPYQINRTEEGIKTFDLDMYIADLEAEYTDAPEKHVELTVCSAKASDNSGENEYVAVEGDDSWNCSFYSGTSGETSTNSVTITRRRSEWGQIETEWQGSTLLKTEQNGEWKYDKLLRYGLKKSELEEKAGITQEEAQRKAEVVIEKLGIGEWNCDYVEPAVLTACSEWGSSLDTVCPWGADLDWGYQFHFMRITDEIPSLYTGKGCYSFYSDPDTENSEMDDGTKPSIQNEFISIVISDKGLEKLNLVNISAVVSVRQENPSLLTWEEVTAKFEDMILVKNAQAASVYDAGEYHRHLDVERITLTYMRIEEAGTGKYLLVPVWDFCGKEWNEEPVEYYMGGDGERHSCYGNDQDGPESLLTINALDGSIIDRGIMY